MTRSEFIKLAIDDPKKAAMILRKNAKQLSECKRVTKTAEVISKTLFVTSRTVFSDAKK